MKRWLSLIIILFIITGFKKPDWGFFAHKRINRLAVFTLPPDLIRFYKQNIEYITDHAVDPDMRRYSVAVEGSHHYIDLDNYGAAPYADLPRNWQDALATHTDLYIVGNQDDTVMVLNHLKVNIKTDSFSMRNSKFFKDSCTIYTKKYKKNLAFRFRDREENGIIPLEIDSLSDFLSTKRLKKENIKSIFIKDELSAHGVLPYNLLQVYNRLIKAFERKDYALILKYSSDIGHYIGDAHVPLHTTSNYNGQKTDQVGIHGFWESRLPELFADETYDYFVGKADEVKDPGTYFWNIVLKSNTYLDSVLLTEKALFKSFPTDNIMCFEDRNGTIVKTYCKDYSTAYHNRMTGMVEDRMRAAIHSVGSIWYSAWVKAGQPALDDKKYEPTLEDLKRTQEENQKFNNGKIIGRPEDH
jgi:hypothetical protein